MSIISLSGVVLLVLMVSPVTQCMEWASTVIVRVQPQSVHVLVEDIMASWLVFSLHLLQLQNCREVDKMSKMEPLITSSTGMKHP
jgi:hypothetical protein